jgi:HlyD family secretion protein
MKASRVLRNLLILAVVVAVAAIAYFKYDRPDDIAPEYRTAPVGRGDIRQLVTASGQVEPVINVQVGSQISGTIERLFVDYNSMVTNGQVLAQIDPAIYRTALKQAEGELANSMASLELARINARRADDLFQNQLIPKSDYDQAVASLHQAEAITQIREAMVDKAQVDLDRTTIFSPIDGIVISRDVEVGQTVAASFNTPKLFVIANDLTKMQIHASVSEADIGGVEPGQSVEFIVDAFPNRKFSGVVGQVRNAAETNQNVITYTTVIDVSNPESKLKPGMTANVSITLAERSDVLKIPNAAFRIPATALRLGSTDASTAEATGGATPSLGQARAAGASGGMGQMSGRPVAPGARANAGSGQGLGAGAANGNTAEERTVYLLESAVGAAKSGPPQLRPVKVRIGITDGAFSEVLEGLKEDDVIVTGVNTATTAAGAAPAAGQNNPFAPPRPPRR